MSPRDLRAELEEFKVWQVSLDQRDAQRTASIREKLPKMASLNDWMANQMKGTTAVADINILKLTNADRVFLAACGIEADNV